MVRRGMATVRVDDFELFYEERGSGPPLVFLHGLGSSTRDWKFQLEHFSRHYRCVAFDLPGSGHSRDLKFPHGPFTVRRVQDYTPVAAKEALAKKISGAQVVVIPNSHHAVPVECPEAFNTVVDAALAKLS